MRISLTGDVLARLLGVGEGSLGTFHAHRRYDLQRIRLLKIGCPRELQASRENAYNVPVVVEQNRHAYGKVGATGFYPDAVVVAGQYRRAQLLAAGVPFAWGWVERGVIEIQADDAISSGELTEKLVALLQQKIYGNNRPLTGQPWPYVCQVYPFENYMIYEFSGQKYRQPFKLDPISRDVALDGNAVKVQEKFIDAGEAGMSKVQTGVRQTSNPLPLASNQVVSRGGAHSDLVTMVVRNFSNVNHVVAHMLDAIKDGLYKPMKPDFAPVNISDDGKILGPLIAAGIAPSDFVIWADRQGRPFMEARSFSDEQRKKLSKTGAAMPDGSYPIVTTTDLEHAVRAFGRSPDSATKRHIIKRAKALGATHMLPDKWRRKEMKAFGHFRSPHMRDVGHPKKAAFKV